MTPEYTSLESLFIPRQREAPLMETSTAQPDPARRGRRALPASVAKEIYSALVDLIAFGVMPSPREARHRK